MRLRSIYSVIAMFCCLQAFPQSDSSKWDGSADLNFYLIPDDFFLLPVMRADKNKLHLEARYNYEDRQTFSGWVGYNFKGGNKLEYIITPMAGGVVGLSNGIAPGLEFTFGLGGFELYSESELFLDLNVKDNDFYYNWTDLTYSVKDWLWFGLSAQRTRLYKTDLEIQRGLLAGAALKKWQLTTYFYNAGFGETFFLVTASTSLRPFHRLRRR